MLKFYTIVILFYILILQSFGQYNSQGAPQQASNLLNPNISVIGNFLVQGGNDNTLEDNFILDELELGLQAVIDPFARADMFVAFSPKELIDIEEGYVTFFTIPYGLLPKVGKFRASFGKFNTTHPPETPFADRPLSALNFLGEEGAASPGISVNWLPDIASLYLSLDAEVTDMWDEAPAVGDLDTTSNEIAAGGKLSDLLYLTRASTYFDLNESNNLQFGTSYAHGVHDADGNLDVNMINFDITYRWKNPRRAIYKSVLWQTEFLTNFRQLENLPTAKSIGLFSYVDWQFLRRWRTGVRYDFSQFPETNDQSEQGGLIYITFTPSEFMLISVQSRIVNRSDDTIDAAGFLKLTFNIGPHGAHPF
jgi:hypothetical protein